MLFRSEGARISDDGDVRAASNDEMSAAAQWLADLRVVANRGQLYAMPAGDMDIRAALKFGHNVLVDDAISTAATRVATVLQLNAIGTAVQIYDGSVSDSTWRRLRELGVESLIIIGWSTSLAVMMTALDGWQHGYSTTVLSDLTIAHAWGGHTVEENQQWTLGLIKAMAYSRIATKIGRAHV